MLQIFILTLALNWPWEILHSALYASYQGGSLTSFILFRAALGDAVILSILFLIAEKLTSHKTLFIVLGGLLVAVAIELLALHFHHWQYNSLMPLIPFLNIGLTPTIQLAVTGYFVQKLKGKFL